MENPWSPLAVRRCSRSQSTRKMGRSSAGQRYKCWSFVRLQRNSSEIVSLTCLFGAGVLPAKGTLAQRSKWLRGTQSAYRTDRPGLLLGIVSTPQTAERGWEGQTGPAYHFWITRGQRAHLPCLLKSQQYVQRHCQGRIQMLTTEESSSKSHSIYKDPCLVLLMYFFTCFVFLYLVVLAHFRLTCLKHHKEMCNHSSCD